MKALVGIAKVYDTILEETKERLVIVKDNETFIGALFFKQAEWDIINEYVEQVEVDGSVLDIILKAIELKKKYNLKVYPTTIKTMIHWQHVNGFSNELFIDAYSYENDIEYLKSLGVSDC